jgi:prophage regulatory protein
MPQSNRYPAVVAEQAEEPKADRFLSWAEVHSRTTLSRSTVWRQVRNGGFPHPVRITAGRVAWRESEIEAWIGAKR